jgi:hypothetical protein
VASANMAHINNGTRWNMDAPFYGDPEMVRRARAPVAIWVLLAVIGIVLGAAAMLAAVTTDTRDFATRHATVLASRNL